VNNNNKLFSHKIFKFGRKNSNEGSCTSLWDTTLAHDFNLGNLSQMVLNCILKIYFLEELIQNYKLMSFLKGSSGNV